MFNTEPDEMQMIDQKDFQSFQKLVHTFSAKYFKPLQEKSGTTQEGSKSVSLSVSPIQKPDSESPTKTSQKGIF